MLEDHAWLRVLWRAMSRARSRSATEGCQFKHEGLTVPGLINDLNAMSGSRVDAWREMLVGSLVL